MYPASLMALQAVALLMILPRRDGAVAALAARMSVVLAAIAAGVLVTDYGIQVAVVQPSLIKGETAGIGLLSQNNPHGVFIALENVGYLLLGLAFAAASVAADARSRADIEYRFEVAGIVIDWLVLIITGILLGVGSRKHRSTDSAGAC
jgi:hypothetical protein